MQRQQTIQMTKTDLAMKEKGRIQKVRGRKREGNKTFSEGKQKDVLTKVAEGRHIKKRQKSNRGNVAELETV